eukprot:scaffold22945_cov32-Phaeocystis_antarctica.AAC.2
MLDVSAADSLTQMTNQTPANTFFIVPRYPSGVWGTLQNQRFRWLVIYYPYTIALKCVVCGAPQPLVNRHLGFGPNSTRPAQIWPYACVPDPNCSVGRASQMGGGA